MPAVFVAHGSPMAAVEDDDHTRALARLGRELPRPQAIVVVSAHGEAPGPIRVTSAERPSLVYDFGGFPEELYRVTYPSPGAPVRAARIVEAFRSAGFRAEADPKRGLDHGVWVPLVHAFPAADVPVVQVTLPLPRSPEDAARMGRALAPLRDEGVLLLGSGGIVHNLRRIRLEDKAAPVDEWAMRFDAGVRERLGDPAELARYRAEAPEAALAVPTPEHFDPVFVVLGAALPGDRIVDVGEGFQYGNLSTRGFALRPAQGGVKVSAAQKP